MKTVKSLLFGIALSLPFISWQQSNDCSSATTLPVTANCSSPTNGTTAGATQTIAGCSGTADDDVWYQFTATATSHQITVTGSATFDAVVQVFSGACASLVSLSCTDLTFNGQSETVYLSGLTIGQVYKLRVYHYGSGSGSGTFTICCTVGAAAPANNNCSTATALTVNTSCVTTNGTTLGATQSVAGCAGTADDDVWYSFVATNASQTITVTPTTSTFDAVFQVYSGTCGALNSEACIDNTFANDPETSTVVGLTPGQTYYVRVYDYYSSSPGTFTICVTGPATAAPTNDNPCSAIAFPPVTSDCNYLEFTTVGATNTAVPGAPSSCIGGSGAANGGFSAGTLDVWFSIVVPASGTLFITPKPNMGAGRISDGVMVLYSGTCSSLTQIVCSDDNNFPGTGNDLLPFISATGLTPGSTVFLRFFGYGTSSGTFGLCITTATNDACSNALYICDLNGYSASTSAAFTPDRPCNMRGNAEQNNPPTYTYTPGTNQGGIFGSAGAWGTGSTSPDVQINNNSWIRFTAASTTAVLNVSVSDCWVGNYPSGGIQMQIFSSNGSCCNFTPVSNFEENSSSFTITANNLTAGNDYYLMVDGFAGDICNYTITAQSGVQFPEIQPVAPICAGQSVTLNAPLGGSSYYWMHNGAITSSVNVTPATTQNYSVDVYGICGYKQTLTTTVTVNPIPAAPVLGANQSICVGNTLNLTANLISGATYSWSGPNSFTSSAQNPSISNVSTLASGVYSCYVTVNGCTSPAATTTVTVNTIPATPSPANNGPICQGSTVNLSQATVGGATYSWTGPNSFSSTAEDPSFGNGQAVNAGTYNVTVTVNGCTSAVGSTVLTVNTAAQVDAGANLASCNGATVNLAGSSGGSASSVSWSNGDGSFSNSNSATSTYTPSASEVTAGSVVLTLTTNDPAGPCPAASDVMTIVISSSPSANFSYPNPSYCQSSADPSPVFPIGGSGGVFSSTAGLSINSSSGAIDVSASTPGIYTVQNFIAANGSCPSANATTSFEVIATPATPGVSNNGLICENGTIQLNGPTVSGGTYSWTGPNSFSSTTEDPAISNASATEEGTYNLVVTVNGCPSLAGTTNVVVTPNPNVVITNGASATVCMNDVLTITASGASSYVWSTAEITNSIDITGTSNTSYSVTGTTAGCSSTASINIVVNPLPGLSVSPTSNNSNCDSPTGSLVGIAVTGAPTLSYLWQDGLGNTIGITSDLLNVNAGNYSVEVTDGNGCTATFGPFTISNFPTPSTPVVNFTDASPCLDIPVTGSISTVNGGSYSWTGPNGFTNSTSSFTLDPVQLTNSGTYCAIVTVNGCQSSPGCADLTVNTLPTVSVSSNSTNNNTYCLGANASLFAAGNGAFSWSGPNNFSSTNDTVNFNPAFGSQSGLYVVSITDGNGCSNADSITIAINSNAFGGISGPAELCPGQTLILTATGGDTYSWNGPNLFTSSNAMITIPTFTQNQAGIYIVQITDSLGCITSDTTEVSVLHSSSCLDIPELVTPDGNGSNDTWDVEGLEYYPEAEVFIYNRWGNLIYQVSPYTTPWNGEPNNGLTIDGKSGKVPFGTYFYQIKLNDSEGTEYKGYLELQY